MPPYLVVLGITQDAGYPQADCEKDCCRPVWEGKASGKMVSCLGLVDPITGPFWMLDATPDFRQQLQLLQEKAPLEGIFLNQIPGRDMSQIPHPFVAESMARFDQLPVEKREKVHFIHLNHTNPLIWSATTRSEVQEKHYRTAAEGIMLSL